MSDSRQRDGRSPRNRGATLFGQVPQVGGGSGGGDGRLLAQLLGANFNSTADQSITIPTGTVRVTGIQVTNASVSMTTAAGGFYTGAAKTGTAIVAASQVYSALTSASVVLNCTLAAWPAVQTQIYLALTTAQGVAATADVYVYGVML